MNADCRDANSPLYAREFCHRVCELKGVNISHYHGRLKLRCYDSFRGPAVVRTILLIPDPLLLIRRSFRFVDTAIIYGLAALMAYEYVLTFHREVTTIWPKEKRSGPAWLFIINRYLLLLAAVLACSPSSSAHVCLIFASHDCPRR